MGRGVRSAPAVGTGERSGEGVPALKIHSCGKAGGCHQRQPQTSPRWQRCGGDNDNDVLWPQQARPAWPAPLGSRLCCPPKAAKPGSLLWPCLHICQSQQEGAIHSRSASGLKGARCANCWHPSFQLPQRPAGGAPTAPGQCVPFHLLLGLFFLFSFFFAFLFSYKNKKITNNQTNKKNPSVDLPRLPHYPQGGEGRLRIESESSYLS